LEVSQGYMPMMNELFNEEYDIREGRVYPPTKPGIGFTLRDDAMERFKYVEGPEYVF
jgi:L-alanine-DL-glutamate epimerase-like enolase superfamily enzyme